MWNRAAPCGSNQAARLLGAVFGPLIVQVLWRELFRLAVERLVLIGEGADAGVPLFPSVQLQVHTRLDEMQAQLA